MSRTTKNGRKLTDLEIEHIALEFENREVTTGEAEKILRTRRREPRLGEATAEVLSFRAPPSYKERIRRRAKSDATTESQVIRDALDAYLQGHG